MTPLKHYVHSSIVSSRRPIDIALIGAGGTGSQVLSGLARMNQALKSPRQSRPAGPGVRWRQRESVECGAQLFSLSDVGKNKAVVLVTRLNMFFGTNWEAYPFNVLKGLRLPGGIMISSGRQRGGAIPRQGHRVRTAGSSTGWTPETLRIPDKSCSGHSRRWTSR